MPRRTPLALLIAAASLLVAPAGASAQLGDVVPLPFPAPEADVQAASSSATHPPALVVDDVVRFADAGGRWHGIKLPAGAVDVRLARIEDGGGLVAWSGEDTVQVRTWTRDGAVSPAEGVLAWTGDLAIAHDGAGTVALFDLGERLTATVRDPGGTFGEPQDLGRTRATVQRTFAAVAGPDGVRVRWDGRGAVRPPGAAGFTPAPPWPADPNVLAVDGAPPVPIGPAVRALCDIACEDARLFTWPDGTARLLYGVGYQWRIARPDASGRFDGDELATRVAGYPLWTERPGVVAFTRSLLPGLGLVPYGVAPTGPATFRVFTAVSGGRLLNAAGVCRTTCRVSVKSKGVLPLLDHLGERVGERALEPFEPFVVSWYKPRRRVRVTFKITDAQGRVTRRAYTLKRGERVTDGVRMWRVTR